jgi:hypothetical protein
MTGFLLGVELIGCLLEGLQSHIPQGLDVAAQGRETLRVELVDALVAALLDGNEVDLAQDSQVLGDGGLADLDDGEELSDRGGTLAQPFDEQAAGGICKRFERGNISHNLYKYKLIY